MIPHHATLTTLITKTIANPATIPRKSLSRGAILRPATMSHPATRPGRPLASSWCDLQGVEATRGRPMGQASILGVCSTNV